MDASFMKMALELAARARGRTSPNPLVGAVVVKNGRPVGSGYHQKAGTPHAEVHALKAAGSETRGADLYVTLEPCNHTGRTPPCTEAIIQAGIKSVYIAVLDPNPLVAGKGVDRLQAAGISVQVGLLAEEAYALNEPYFKYIRTRLPFVALKAALTLDGKIAAATGESRWITGEQARLHSHQLRATYDAILIGMGTVRTDNPSLTCRLPGGAGRDPARIILDSRLSIPEHALVLNQDSPAPTIIATTTQAAPARVSLLEKKASVLVINDGPQVDLSLLLKKLGEMEITSLLVEGGGLVNGSFFRENLVDKYYFYFAPKILGSKNAPGPFDGVGPLPLAQALELANLNVTPLGKDLLISGTPLGQGRPAASYPLEKNRLTSGTPLGKEE